MPCMPPDKLRLRAAASVSAAGAALAATLCAAVALPGRAQAATVADVTALFAEKCTDCHNPLGPARRGPSGGLDLETDPFAALLNVDAEEETAEAENLKRVVPGNPEESLLYLKVSATTEEFKYGDAMPAPERDQPWVRLPASEIELIRSWIAAGAPTSGEITSSALRRPESAFRAARGNEPLRFRRFRLDGRAQAPESYRPDLPHHPLR